MATDLRPPYMAGCAAVVTVVAVHQPSLRTRQTRWSAVAGGIAAAERRGAKR